MPCSTRTTPLGFGHADWQAVTLSSKGFRVLQADNCFSKTALPLFVCMERVIQDIRLSAQRERQNTIALRQQSPAFASRSRLLVR